MYPTGEVAEKKYIVFVIPKRSLFADIPVNTIWNVILVNVSLYSGIHFSEGYNKTERRQVLTVKLKDNYFRNYFNFYKIIM